MKRHQEVEPAQLRPTRQQVCSLDLQTSRPKNHCSQEISAPIGESERDKSAAASGANLELKQLHLERINNSVGGRRESAASRFWRSSLKVVFQPCSVEGARKRVAVERTNVKGNVSSITPTPPEEAEPGK